MPPFPSLTLVDVTNAHMSHVARSLPDVPATLKHVPASRTGTPSYPRSMDCTQPSRTVGATSSLGTNKDRSTMRTLALKIGCPVPAPSMQRDTTRVTPVVDNNISGSNEKDFPWY